jgi:hypothetical protein
MHGFLLGLFIFFMADVEPSTWTALGVRVLLLSVLALKCTQNIIISSCLFFFCLLFRGQVFLEPRPPSLITNHIMGEGVMPVSPKG